MKKSKYFFLGMVILVLSFGLVFAGCSNGSTSKGGTIAPEFRGKWEVSKIIYNSTTYILPVSINGFYIETQGYEVGDTWATAYRNGTMVESDTGLYSKGGSIYNSDGYTGATLKRNGDQLIFTENNAIAYCTKVTSFSWEL